jgi:c-di-GMP phosphodiesterase
MMLKTLNGKTLYLIPIIFFIVVVFRIFYNYQDTKQREYNFAKSEAEVLNSYSMAHRNYYQKLFIDKTIKLNEKTLEALPAFSSLSISKTFSQDNSFNIRIQTVSDRARNPKNAANSDELKAIEFFKSNPASTQYFSDENVEFYQYASALRIEEKCLKCHDSRQNAPLFIQTRYDKAYDYKLGELRGIMSIAIPKKILNGYFLKYFFQSVAYDAILFILLFFAVYKLASGSKMINDYLKIEVKKKTDELKKSLIINPLTGLPNRLKLIDDLEIHKNDASRHLALLNIDRFKDVNDFYGHEKGDVIMRQVASTISDLCVKNSATAYKLPSDEYAIFTVANITEEEFIDNINAIIQKIQETQYKLDYSSMFITLSVGLASNIEALIIKADMALQISKSSKQNLVVYSDAFDATKKITDNLNGVLLLKEAIKNDWIEPFFQPIYNVKSKKVEKYEALVRIVKADGEIILPYAFLQIAIKSKLYPRITELMIEKSFEIFKNKDCEFSINLSIDDVLNQKTQDFILESLKNYGAPDRVVFEILESEKIENYADLEEFIKKVRKFNSKIAIDDFGSGYSNFSHILELNVDYLKIDASLVKYVTRKESSRRIVQTIIHFASDLNLKTIAEYVEDKEAFDLLESMGVDFVQGYYIGKPEKELLG